MQRITRNIDGNMVRNRREELGLSYKELADEVKVSVNTIRLWETNKYNPTLENVAILTKALAVRDTFFYCQEEESFNGRNYYITSVWDSKKRKAGGTWDMGWLSTHANVIIVGINLKPGQAIWRKKIDDGFQYSCKMKECKFFTEENDNALIYYHDLK